MRNSFVAVMPARADVEKQFVISFGNAVLMPATVRLVMRGTNATNAFLSHAVRNETVHAAAYF